MKMKGPHTPDPEVARLLGQTLDEYQAELEPEPQERAFEEGRPQHFRATQYERNPAARIACIEHYGPQCAACGLSFGSAYGPMMEGFILVHHLELISASRDRHSVNPTRDMRPVCANCHAVMHRRTPPFTVIEVKRMLRESVRTETKQPVAMEVSARSRRRRTKGGHGDGR
jgi:predicted HNH restriction endonuclease